MKINMCLTKGCEAKPVKRGMCDRHYRSALKKGGIQRARVFGGTVKDRLLFHSKYISDTGCREWIGSVHQATGYGNITINGSTVSTHRASWETANGPIPSGMHILHKCDNPSCINPEHLFLGTNAQNVADMDTKGRRVAHKGEKHPRAKLTDDLVSKIRVDPRTHRVIAKELGVGPSIIGLVKQHKIWRHIP